MSFSAEGKNLLSSLELEFKVEQNTENSNTQEARQSHLSKPPSATQTSRMENEQPEQPVQEDISPFQNGLSY